MYTVLIDVNCVKTLGKSVDSHRHADAIAGGDIPALAPTHFLKLDEAFLFPA